MDKVNVVIGWVSWALAAYMVAVTLFLAANIAIGAIKTRSALWWYLVYSVVVVGMMLAGLEYLPSMVLEAANEGIEAAAPEMERFAGNVQGIFDTAASSGSLPPAGSNPQTAVLQTETPPPPGGNPNTDDPNAGGGAGAADLPPTAPPILTTPTVQATPTLNLTTNPADLYPAESDLQATAASMRQTVVAVSSPTREATPGPTPTYDILKPPTPIIQP